MKSFVFCIAAAFIFSTSTANADVFIDAGPNGTVSSWGQGDYVAGSEFTVSGNPLTVNTLGWIDAEGDGLVASHRVGLWDVATGGLLAEATVTPGSFIEASANGTAQWFTEHIGTNLVLNPGVYRVAGIVGTVGDNAVISDDQIGNGVTVSADYWRTDFPSGGFNFPTITFGTTPIRATVGFRAIPEPSSLFLLAGLGTIGLIRRNKR